MSVRLLDRIAGVPWLIHEPALQTIMEIAGREDVDPANLEAWKGCLAPEALEMRQAAPLPGARKAELRDGVAILRVSGPIFRHAGLMTEVSGATATADLARDLTLARDDSRVRGIMLDVNSPGGEVTGLGEMADAIRAASAIKPVIAYAEGQAASAAYLLASAAQEIVVAPMAMVGSLGAVLGATDTRERDARSGVRRYQFVSSQTPGKRPDPATDAGRAEWQRIADATAAEFLAHLSDLRGLSVEDMLAATHGGGMVLGRDAVAAGLADRIGGFEETLARLSAGEVAPAATRPRMRPSAKERSMPTSSADTIETPAAAEPAPTQAPVPEAPQPPDAAAPTVDPVAVERARVSAIMAAARPHGQALARLAVDEGWSAEAFARAQSAAEEGARAASVAQFREQLPAPVAGGAPVDPATLPPAERAAAEFAASEKVRAEFGSVERYAAFLTAQARGAIRIISRAG